MEHSIAEIILGIAVLANTITIVILRRDYRVTDAVVRIIAKKWLIDEIDKYLNKEK